MFSSCLGHEATYVIISLIGKVKSMFLIIPLSYFNLFRTTIGSCKHPAAENPSLSESYKTNVIKYFQVPYIKYNKMERNTILNHGSGAVETAKQRGHPKSPKMSAKNSKKYSKCRPHIGKKICGPAGLRSRYPPLAKRM
jgi:hypothetical protein